ncbi:MATE efflux family protein [Basidiobolus meristosporus CBS 931.73]|uniref:MATE efflux family protein n=1 Tax=Basidiobolus meristosporus CBS 931.73 TaxID=1314790 RepID=A0A1Y1YI14_9FUNG|nr:MATE efflux family protein [Basidiobolus meristosporus CBS 931.73]|eukprot:ORX97523.1 MATE efflux family protein [Basidiobolus meristosporus CBS 931.73]
MSFESQLQDEIAKSQPVIYTTIENKALSASDESTSLLGRRASSDADPGNHLVEIRTEAFIILSKALPVLISALLSGVTRYGVVFSLGSLGTKELAACALGGVFEACTVISPFLGIITALETLCSQAHTASENKHVLGVYLQRAMLIQLTLLVPIAWCWAYTEQILVAMGQNPEIARLTGVFVIWSLPGVTATMLVECIKRYLNAQGIMRVSAYVSAVTAPVSLVLFYLLVIHPTTTLGFVGAPLAAGITNLLSLALYIAYTVFIEGSQGWGGFSSEAFRGWWDFMKLGFPGMIMISSELWAFETIALCASYLGTVALAAQTIIETTLMLFIMIPVGISISASNRVGNLLGSSQPYRAALVAKTSIGLGAMIGLLNCIFLWTLRDKWGYLYNRNEEVVLFASRILPVVALFQPVGSVCNGVLRGLGKQKVGAFIKLCSYYLIALPLGLLLTFHCGYGLKGLWLGLMIAYIVCFVMELSVIIRTNWNTEVMMCLYRLALV